MLQGWWELAPRYADLGLELAQQLIEQGRSQEAIPVLEGLMFVDPLQGLPHQLLGELYLEQHQPARAVGEFRVALSLQPADPAGAHFRLASALAAQGDADAARREVLLALEIAPSYPEAQRLLLELVRR